MIQILQAKDKQTVKTMLRRKDISNDLREATPAVHQSGKAYKTVPKQFVHHSTDRKIIQKQKNVLPRSRHPNKFTIRFDYAKLKVLLKKKKNKSYIADCVKC